MTRVGYEGADHVLMLVPSIRDDACRRQSALVLIVEARGSVISFLVRTETVVRSSLI